jgi:hypothetical protein
MDTSESPERIVRRSVLFQEVMPRCTKLGLQMVNARFRGMAFFNCRSVVYREKPGFERAGKRNIIGKFTNLAAIWRDE